MKTMTQKAPLRPGRKIASGLRRAVVGAALLIPCSPNACAGEALVATAANFGEVIERLKVDFEAISGHRIIISLASTGKLYAQIRSGAPFDVLLAADQEHPQKLEDEELAVPGSRFTYAVGRLTLWSPNPSRVSADGAETLAGKDFERLAIANPELAPYGAAALQALRSLGLFESLSDRLVMGENIAQTFAYVSTGNAELGLVALSQVLSRRNRAGGSRWDVPPRLYQPILQDAVLLSRANSNPAARAFLEFLGSDAARKRISEAGYGLE